MDTAQIDWSKCEFSSVSFGTVRDGKIVTKTFQAVFDEDGKPIIPDEMRDNYDGPTIKLDAPSV